MRRSLSLALYYVVFQSLPNSRGLGGGVARYLRQEAARNLLAYTGGSVNIERRVFFGTGGKIDLGDRSGIGMHSRLVGSVKIGDGVMIGPEALILTQNHKIDDISTLMIDQELGPVQPVRLEDGCWIGARVIILPGVTVGRGAVVGAGSVVTRDVEELTVVAGNPAKVIRRRVVELPR